MITTIIFDLNKVLITHEDIDLDAEYKKYFGMTQKEFWKVGKEIFYTYENPDKIQLDTFLLRILDYFHFDHDVLPVLTTLYEQAFSLVKGIEPLMTHLKEKYTLILLAGDGKDSFHFKTSTFHLEQFFSAMYCSADFAMRKTRKELYELILKKHTLKADEVLFIDDLQEHLTAAGSVGIHTILFKHVAQLKRELQNFSIH